MPRKLLLAVALLSLAAGPATGQQAKSPEAVILLAGDAGQSYATLGALSVETHQTSLFPKISPQQQLETELRKQAAALGADAVIHVKYEFSNAATSKKGNKALGVAVKFAAPAAPALVQPIPTPAVVAPAPLPVPAPAPFASAPAHVATPAAPPAPVPVAPAPVASAPITSPPVPTSPAVHAATPEMVMLTESTILGRPYTKIKAITVTTHQTSLFPKTPAMTELQAALKAEALKAGADAVIEVRYAMSNPMASKKGNTAVGVAVRFD